MVGLDKKQTKGPMHMAFVIPNPLLPEDFFTREQVDEFVLEMNADVTHSLLDCPGRYSVRVATFTRRPAPSTSRRSPPAARNSSWKAASSRPLNRPTSSRRPLRKNGWQAWEYHDRESSIVCVGGFEQVQLKQADGSLAMNPEITRIIAGLGPDPTSSPPARSCLGRSPASCSTCSRSRSTCRGPRPRGAANAGIDAATSRRHARSSDADPRHHESRQAPRARGAGGAVRHSLPIACRLPQAVDVDETGTTFAENAALKAGLQAQALEAWVLAEDSGLVVDGAYGRPASFRPASRGGGD